MMALVRNSIILRTILLMLIVVVLCPFVYGRIIYVEDDANGVNDGSSWENAYIYLHNALSEAQSGDEIWVAGGIYKPDQRTIAGGRSGDRNIATGEREATFQMINGVTILGGYAGIDANDPNARDIELYESTLSGDLNDDDGPYFTNNSENSYHIITGNNCDQTAILNGFTITAGNANGNDWKGNGGGMYNEDCSPTVSNCVFSYNYAIGSGGAMENISSSPMLTNCTFSGNSAEEDGGGMNNGDSSSPTLSNCIFSKNSTETGGGGGMNNWGESTPVLSDCTFNKNLSRTGGGGMCNVSGSSPMLSNCTFSDNSAGWGGGGIDNYDSCNPTLTNCTFSGNSATWDGGGLCNSTNSHPTITNCTFINNTAENYKGGGMFNLSGSSPTITNCTFIGNSAEEEGGGMYNGDCCSPTLNNCTFSENSAGNSGGGMRNWDSSPTLTNCAFNCNSSEGNGGGMDNFFSSPLLTNCMFTENDAAAFASGGGIFIESGFPVFTDCNFTGNTAGHGGGISSVHSSSVVTNCTFQNNVAEYLAGGIHMNNELGGHWIFTDCTFSENKSYLDGGGVDNTFNDSEFNRCVFKGNSALWGGGMSNGESSPTLNNCTFSSNSADTGGGMANGTNCFPTLKNCILWDNTAPSGPQIYDEQGSSTTVSYSNVQYSGRSSWPGEGNIKTDPLFADPDNGDYHLKSGAGRWDPNSQSWILDDVNSPCIDAGDPNSPVASEPYPNGIIINMGAYGGTAQASKSPSGLHAKYGHGTGEQNNPYFIYTVEHLNTLGSDANDYNKHFKLMADVNLAEYEYNMAVIAPDIGGDGYTYPGTPFTGIFDGNGREISNLTITGQNYLGLFGKLDVGGIVKDLGIVDANIIGSYYAIGGLVGDNDQGNVISSYSTGTVTGYNFVGGLVGYNNYGNIALCYSNCSANGTSIGNQGIGGLVGVTAGNITMSYSTGDVSGERKVGGLVGRNYQSNITNCYSICIVSGDSDIGGLVGLNENGNITASFWDMETSGQTTSDGGIGKTTAEMQTVSTFLDAGWDFIGETENGDEDIWWIDEWQDYPKLWWEIIAEN